MMSLWPFAQVPFFHHRFWRKLMHCVQPLQCDTLTFVCDSCTRLRFFAPTLIFVSILVSGIKTCHLLNLCRSVRTGKCARNMSYHGKWDFRKCFKKILLLSTTWLCLLATTEYLKTGGRFRRRGFLHVRSLSELILAHQKPSQGIKTVLSKINQANYFKFVLVLTCKILSFFTKVYFNIVLER